MHRNLVRVLGVGVAAASLGVLGLAPAQAVSYHNGNYGSMAHENAYPNGNHACGGGHGWSQPVSAKSYRFAGRTLTIRLCYSNSYGAYARLDGAAVNDSRCKAILDRSNSPHETKSWSSVWETVDSNVGYAYTKVGNDLHGRLARAAVSCDGSGKAPAQTAWY